MNSLLAPMANVLTTVLALAAVLALTAVGPAPAQAGDPFDQSSLYRPMRRRAPLHVNHPEFVIPPQTYYLQGNPHEMTWQAGWYDTTYGAPLALVVPPSVTYMGQYHWGMPASSTVPVAPQFGRINPTLDAFGQPQGIAPSPYYPSHTNRLGIYAVRGPWW